jgi:hypothetical protein
MITKSTLKGEIVKAALKKFKGMPIKAIARKVYSENKRVFNSDENARRIVRYYCGKSGERSRKELSDKSFVRKEKGLLNPWSFIPLEHNFYAEKWTLPKQFKKVLIIGDVHIPYHDAKSIKVCFEYAKKQNVDCVYVNGDLLDFYDVSFHEKDIRKRPSMDDELEMGHEFLKGLKKYFGCQVYYKPANHEYRLERYLAKNLKELANRQEWRLDVLLRLGELKIQYIDRRSKCYFGKLLVEHGDRMKSGGQNPSKTLYDKYKRDCLCNHFHKKTETIKKIYDGQLIKTYSIGSLCCLEPEYFEVNEHTNGFAIVSMFGDEYDVSNKHIEGNKVY